MLIRMRTTLVLDDALVRQAKQRALDQDVTLSEVVNESLRTSLMRVEPDAAPFSMVTYGRGGAAVEHEPADFASALESEDADRVR